MSAKLHNCICKHCGSGFYGDCQRDSVCGICLSQLYPNGRDAG